MIEDIIKIANIVGSLLPKDWQNIKVDFQVREINLRFVCDDKNIGYFRVTIYSDSNDSLAYVEGHNHEDSHINIGQNTRNYSEEFLLNSFHMCRCRREFERTDDINYSKGYDYFKRQVLSSYKN